MIKVLFVCLGNICRSPTAHGVFLKKINDQKLDQHIYVDSAGTGDWHVGEQPDTRAIKAAAQRGYDLLPLRARQVQESDFVEFDYIMAMDGDNVRNLRSICPEQFQHKIQLLLDYGQHAVKHVPDPYYGNHDGFENVVDLIETASDHLLVHITATDLK